MKTYELITKFIDGEELKLKGVSDYGLEDGYWYVTKNGYRIFLNSSEVKYIGRVFDIENIKVGEMNG